MRQADAAEALADAAAAKLQGNELFKAGRHALAQARYPMHILPNSSSANLIRRQVRRGPLARRPAADGMLRRWCGAAQVKYEGTLSKLNGLRGLDPEDEAQATATKLQARAATSPLRLPPRYFTSFTPLLRQCFGSP